MHAVAEVASKAAVVRLNYTEMNKSQRVVQARAERLPDDQTAPVVSLDWLDEKGTRERAHGETVVGVIKLSAGL
jgi:hypothetical protein